jgi:hypothetical protein
VRMNVRPFRRRTRFDRVVKAARDGDLPSAIRSALPDIHPSKGVKSGVTAVVATTAASAAISAVRRRMEGASSHKSAS